MSAEDRKGAFDQEILKHFSPRQMALLRDQFDEFDIDRSGAISPEELDAVLLNLQEPHTQDDIAAMIAEVDLNKDGTISFNEFLAMIYGLQTGHRGGRFAVIYEQLHQVDEGYEKKATYKFTDAEVQACFENHPWWIEAEKNLKSKPTFPREAIVWSDEQFGVNIKKVDLQHKRMLRMLGEMNRMLTEESDNIDLGSLIDGLIDFTVYHFRTEEALFERYDYPERREHALIHQAFTEKITAVAEDFKKDLVAGKAMTPAETELAWSIFNFLEAWIIGHIQHEDGKFGKPLNEAGVF
jgi:hemerythrin-like metal-binding protein